MTTDLNADTGGTSQRRHPLGDPWRAAELRPATREDRPPGYPYDTGPTSSLMSDGSVQRHDLEQFASDYWRQMYERAPRPLTVVLGWIWGFAMGLGTAALILAIR